MNCRGQMCVLALSRKFMEQADTDNPNYQPRQFLLIPLRALDQRVLCVSPASSHCGLAHKTAHHSKKEYTRCAPNAQIRKITHR